MGVVGIEILDQLMYYRNRTLLKFIVDIEIDTSIGKFDSFEKPIKLIVQDFGLKLCLLIERMQLIMHGVQWARGAGEQLFDPLNKAQFNPPQSGYKDAYDFQTISRVNTEPGELEKEDSPVAAIIP